MDEPLHIPLHKFSFAKATDLHIRLKAHLHAANVRMCECEPDGIRAIRPVGYNDGGGVIRYILNCLWILVVKPILDGLPFSVSTLDISFILISNFYYYPQRKNLHQDCHVSGGVQQGLLPFFQYMQLGYMPHPYQRLDPFYLILPSHPTSPMLECLLKGY